MSPEVNLGPSTWPMSIKSMNLGNLLASDIMVEYMLTKCFNQMFKVIVNF